MPNKYPYAPLLPGHVRLLRLEPASESTRITGAIFHVSLSTTPTCDYEALSYTWGPPIAHVTVDNVSNPSIFLQSYVVDVTPNLYTALCCLRHDYEQRVLWIDAICINQEDLKEKELQVQLMSLIYERAKEVIVWLGGEQEDDGAAIDMIKRLHGALPSFEKSRWSVYEEYGLPPFAGPGWHSLVKFLQKRWFSRTWVIQEVVKAQSVLILCGKLSLKWQVLEELLEIFLIDHIHSQLVVDSGVGLKMIEEISRIKRMLVNGTELSILDMLFITTEFEVENPRDKVYGLLGLATSARIRAIKPDYTISPSEVFLNVAFQCLNEGVLDFLSYVDSDTNLDTLSVPSWVPHWNKPRFGRYPFAKYAHCFHAADDLNIGARPSNDKTFITIRGARIDRVQAVGMTCDPDPPQSDGLDILSQSILRGRRVRAHFSQWKSIADTVNPYRHTNEGFLDAYWRTLVCNSDPAGQPAPSEYRESFNAFAEVLNLLFSDTGSEEALSSHSEAWADERWQASIPFAHVVDVWMGGRAFSTTQKGYMGMLPWATETNDIIYVFLGAKTPFVVRPNSQGQYRLVGECYIHGLMNGETSKMPDFGDRLEDIVLI